MWAKQHHGLRAKPSPAQGATPPAVGYRDLPNLKNKSSPVSFYRAFQAVSPRSSCRVMNAQTHGLELLELFIGNNICCPFLLVVNQWRFMVEGPHYWGTVCCVDSSICKNWGVCNPFPGPSGHSRKDFTHRWPKSSLALPRSGTEAEGEDAPWWEG